MRPGAIYMAAQPIVGLADGSLLGYELLARSSIPCSSGPDQWLAHASYLGVRTEFELACLQAACDKGPPPEDVRLFVNLSPRTLLDPRLDQILNALPPRVIEITEHEAVSDYQELRRRLQSWTTATTMLAIDDVGSGYSSMSHVIQLHPQYIKIDRSLVHKAHRDPNKLAVLRGLVGFSRQCGVTSLAEGVETSEELNALRAVGVDLVQGYLLARPDDGWPQPRHWRATETGAAARPGRSPVVVGTLGERVEKMVDRNDAADEVTAYLYENFEFLPSVYVERAGVLRFLSGRGQWQVLDGIERGVGLTGSAFAAGEPVLVQDVSTDPRYREAVPGVVAELAVPLTVDGRIVGVLNVDAPSPLDDKQIRAVNAAGRVLEQAFARTGIKTVPELSPGGVRLACAPYCPITVPPGAGQSHRVGQRRTRPAAVGGPVDPCRGRAGPAGRHGCAGGGHHHSVLRWSSRRLVGLVSHVASSYSTGPVISRTFGPMGLLRDLGFGTVFVAAIRDRDAPSGLLVVAGPDSGIMQAEAVQALELLSVLAGVTVARIGQSA